MAVDEIEFRMRDGTTYLIKAQKVQPKGTATEDGPLIIQDSYIISRVYFEGSEIFNPKKRPRFDSEIEAIGASFDEVKEYHYGKK